MAKTIEQRSHVVIRFAGDSGDGMQITGDRFTAESAVVGNDLATLPDYPAEIRAPAGTLAGVSGFQLHFASTEIHTPGDAPDVLVAMNPAALKANLRDLATGGIIIIDREAFTAAHCEKAGYATSPLEDGSLSAYQVFPVDVTTLTKRALEGMDLPSKAATRSRNFFCLGLTSWLFHRPIEPSLQWLRQKFAKRPELAEANTRALQAGHAFAETTELFAVSYEVKPAALAPGTYRHTNGAAALCYGLIAASERSGREILYSSYPITPASELLHELARHKALGVKTFQAEDEIAAIGAALGAAFGGGIGVTATSGPGLDLKSETLGLAVMVELPLVVIDVQRAGPSTGMPTKTEQSDCFAALYGRHGEAPVPVLAVANLHDCFQLGYEAVRLAIKYMTPVIVLSDTFLANGAEPWQVPVLDQLPAMPAMPTLDPANFAAYRRDAATGARPWAVPGMAGCEHRIGGLSKAENTGNVSYDPENHERMARLRAEKVAGIVREIPPTEIFGPASGEALIIGWGSTYGAIRTAVQTLQGEGRSIAHVHLRYLNPLPADLGDILQRFQRIIVPELNFGQLVQVLRGRYACDAVAINKLQGRPFQVSELIRELRCVAFDEGCELAKHAAQGGAR